MNFKDNLPDPTEENIQVEFKKTPRHVFKELNDDLMEKYDGRVSLKKSHDTGYLFFTDKELVIKLFWFNRDNEYPLEIADVLNSKISVDIKNEKGLNSFISDILKTERFKFVILSNLY